VILSLLSHKATGKPAKFLIDERRQLVKRRFIAITPVD
jgi:hypothetical protein